MNIRGEEISEVAYEGYSRLINKYPPLESQELENRLRESRKSHDLSLRIGHGSFYLPPLEEDPEFVATLSLDFKLSSGKMNARIEMHRIIDDSFFGIGYRLEFGVGEHAFSHATLTNKRPDTEDGEFLSGCPTWLPTNIPRILSLGKNPVSLIICVIISLYGVKTVLSNLDVEKKYLHELDHILKF